MIVLVPPGHVDRDALLVFELENRAFFEARINARAPDYYSAAGVTQAIQSAIDDAAAGRGYQFLVKSGDEIIGRINLRDVVRSPMRSAVLGYRIGEAHAGKGHASAALRLLQEIAFGRLGLVRIEAGVHDSNLASARVLLRNGFVQFDQTPNSVELDGVWHDRLHFERYAQ